MKLKNVLIVAGAVLLFVTWRLFYGAYVSVQRRADLDAELKRFAATMNVGTPKMVGTLIRFDGMSVDKSGRLMIFSSLPSVSSSEISRLHVFDDFQNRVAKETCESSLYAPLIQRGADIGIVYVSGDGREIGRARVHKDVCKTEY